MSQPLSPCLKIDSNFQLNLSKHDMRCSFLYMQITIHKCFKFFKGVLFSNFIEKKMGLTDAILGFSVYTVIINIFINYISKVQTNNASWKFVNLRWNHITVCNFESMETPVELNSLLSKFFCYITWSVISPDQTRLWTTCNCFFETIA